jgi:hypothetical protein
VSTSSGRFPHCDTQPWDLHEFYVDGVAHPVDDLAARQMANAGTGFPRDDHFVLFELEVTSAFSTVFGPDGQAVRQRWRALPRRPDSRTQ